ncbi:helix-turn-helix domain-containing protein [Fertoebacter nigrum]|uniref:Helix-turn-helix domain-containing protein n=2 Tax=Fertoeibacter niger TaxID=2656921 RepID=A0A8X8H264_9RHOB|nr:helix-turn-helix domain-containing protein [Fertoeibacter niger]NUB46198.1 helix-turn-helix domain-containing protein [Fertoeibacter niger]
MRPDGNCLAIIDPNQSNKAESDYTSPHVKRVEATPQDHYQTVQDVVGRLEVAEATVRRQIKTGALRAIDIGKGWRVSDTDFSRFLTARGAAPRGSATEASAPLASPAGSQVPDRSSKIP